MLSPWRHVSSVGLGGWRDPWDGPIDHAALMAEAKATDRRLEQAIAAEREARRVKLPADCAEAEAMLRELLDYETKVSKDGQHRYGSHDDLVVALEMACQGTWRPSLSVRAYSACPTLSCIPHGIDLTRLLSTDTMASAPQRDGNRHRSRRRMTAVPRPLPPGAEPGVLARILYRLRHESGMTQKEVSRRAGWEGNSRYSDLERGAVKLPNKETVARLEKAFGLEPGWIEDQLPRREKVMLAPPTTEDEAELELTLDAVRLLRGESANLKRVRRLIQDLIRQ
jgi:transcriptional regulator with XRE-family HTH domain